MKNAGERIEHVRTVNEKYNVLSRWETGFLESISNQFSKRGTLSPNQCKVFAKMEQRCSLEALESLQAWYSAYGPEKHEIATICAKYYKPTGYFTSLAWRVLDDPQCKLTPHEFNKMCENKYAKKVIASVNAKEKYAVGSMVLIRKTAISWRNSKFNDVPCVVIEVLHDEVVSHAKGAKPYKILPFGSSEMLTLEEREIKAYKLSKSKAKKKIKKVVDKSLLF